MDINKEFELFKEFIAKRKAEEFLNELENEPKKLKSYHKPCHSFNFINKIKYDNNIDKSIKEYINDMQYLCWIKIYPNYIEKRLRETYYEHRIIVDSIKLYLLNQEMDYKWSRHTGMYPYFGYMVKINTSNIDNNYVWNFMKKFIYVDNKMEEGFILCYYGRDHLDLWYNNKHIIYSKILTFVNNYH